VGKICLAGFEVVIAGGDAREVILAGELAKAGASVWLYGFARYPFKNSDIRQGRPSRTDVLIFPLPGINPEGHIYAPYAAETLHLEELAPIMRPGTLILSGKIPNKQHEKLESLGVTVVFTADLDELAIYNAVPTAEGAVEVAMRESDITIHGSNALVIGFGRCALPLANTLAALGANVTVAARRREAIAMAEALGFTAISFHLLPMAAGKADFLFNTVPALVLTEEVLQGCNENAVIIDIASAPGGTDFSAAEELGIKGFLALGLPGKVAPVAAGKILAKVYPHIMSIHGKGGE
jgi:dipicolinate synthase subunit A